MTTDTLEKNIVVNCVPELPDELNVELVEIHCTNCGRFLGFQAIVEGTIALKCRQCKQWNILDVHGIEVLSSESKVD